MADPRLPAHDRNAASPGVPEGDRPCYVAHTAIDTFALIEPDGGLDGSDGGSRPLRWWTRTQRVRTGSELPILADLRRPQTRPVYQRIARKAKQMRDLGFSDAAIARRFGVCARTIVKAILWLRDAA